MYSNYRLQVDFSPTRKLKNIISSAYKIKIKATGQLEIEFGCYAEKYYTAAHEVASFLLDVDNTNIEQLDTYFFPLVFLYRHSIELMLKGIAFQFICDKEARKLFVNSTFHNLEKILEETLSKRKSSRSDSEIEWLRAYFADISKVDRESDSFRYPFHIKRESNILYGVHFSLKRVFEKQTHIDLVKCVNKFEAAYEILRLWYDNTADEAKEWKGLSTVFLEEGGGYYGQAVVGYGYHRQDFYPYFNAYVEVASLLRQKMICSIDKSGYLTQDMFLPMCYLYRNAVELAIKAIWIEEIREIYQKRCEILYVNKHKIVKLWEKLQVTLLDCSKKTSNSKSYYADIKKCCEDLHDFDGDANKFRYPCTKRMEPLFRSDKVYDIMNIAEFMEGLISAIDGIGTELSVQNELIDDMRMEIGADNYAEQCIANEDV